jgi:hypothetical protein
MNAPAPDGEMSMPVAALELIVAKAVAEASTNTSTSAIDGSPAARAARAAALAGRGEQLSARERAAHAWRVLPAVHAGEPDGRPGLSMLSARAGEALASYVAPSAAPAEASARRDGAVLRAPTAAQELVRTGRPAGRHGGGEVEIPPWFEAAARKMFEDRSSSSDGISMAELTLVNAAPATQVAASTRSAPSAAPARPALSATTATSQPQQIDIDRVAHEVYRQILVLMDAARARNGEPYL